ncbi:MAG: hypothetical protein QN141_03625 [Armatimonadota bacterium]|nr:hypothetical protein [Armatimonadota bacterium]MDR7451434.1 hypothetical protein [Armatimonadota bacterium]MDR7466416.1 hypothetical protein [Armatimonadota bacterium]MDR7493138.1 hypothetical protein [Armatimonadota bacterium]MDR7498105.1 hypothetical protein [Armatimonadota bacterium]
MRVLRALGLTLAAVAAVGMAAGAVHLVSLLRLWAATTRAVDPFDASEPI